MWEHVALFVSTSNYHIIQGKKITNSKVSIIIIIIIIIIIYYYFYSNLKLVFQYVYIFDNFQKKKLELLSISKTLSFGSLFLIYILKNNKIIKHVYIDRERGRMGGRETERERGAKIA